MAKIFISFIHEEKKIADAVQDLIRDQLGSQLEGSAGVFLASDQWQVYAGENWLERIRKELTESKVVILMLSNQSVGRPWVNFEAGAAWLQEGKVIIPVCFGGLTKDNLPKPYSSIQSLNLKEEAYYLITSICHHLGTGGLPLALIPPPPSSQYQPDSSYAKLRAVLEEPLPPD
jgi:hypothetical protein